MPNQHTKAEADRRQSIIDAANRSSQRNAELMREKRMFAEIAKLHAKLDELVSFVKQLEETKTKNTK